MAINHILVHLDGTPHSRKRAGVAVALAKRFSAHLSVVFAQADPDEPSDLLPNQPQTHPPVVRDALDEAEKLAKDAGVPVDTRLIPAVSYSQLTKHLTYAVRDSDLAVMGQHDPKATKGELPEDLVEKVVVNSGRPVLVIPYAGEFPHIGERILVGWNGTREAARALHDAMPFLEEAQAVRLLSINPPQEVMDQYERLNESVRNHLKLHGIEAEILPDPNPQVSVPDLLISRATEFEGDMLVLGALGHHPGFGPLRKPSVAKELLRQITMPTLLAH